MGVFETDQTTVLDAPGEGHEQMGKVEMHGRFFEDILQRVIDERQPRGI